MNKSPGKLCIALAAATILFCLCSLVLLSRTRDDTAKANARARMIDAQRANLERLGRYEAAERFLSAQPLDGMQLPAAFPACAIETERLPGNAGWECLATGYFWEAIPAKTALEITDFFYGQRHLRILKLDLRPHQDGKTVSLKITAIAPRRSAP